MSVLLTGSYFEFVQNDNCNDMVKLIVCFDQRGAILLIWGTKPVGLFNRGSSRTFMFYG